MKRIITLLASMALVASGMHILPANAAEEPPTVPEVANIEDPFGDANTLGGDQVTPADGGSVSDIGKVWFSHDDTNFNVHFLTEGPPGTNTVGLRFAVTLGEGGCAVFSGYYAGLTYASDSLGRLVDACNELDPIDGAFTFGEGPGGAGLATITIPRASSPLFADGSTLTAPFAQSWIFAGGEQLTPSGYRGLQQEVDDTKPGADYAILGAPEGKTPPGKNPVPGKKKGCDNGKGKKRGCEGKGKKSPKPGKPAAACAPFQSPNDAHKDNDLVVVTDEATAEAPVEHTVTLDMSVADADVLGTHAVLPSLDNFNIQVDSAAADAGLYALFEFPSRRDYDLNLFHDDGSYAARSHGFNPIIPEGRPTGFSNETGHGGESTDTSEALIGIKTADCGGWSMEVANWLGEGGEMTVKLWLGEAKNDPQEPGKETP